MADHALDTSADGTPFGRLDLANTHGDLDHSVDGTPWAFIDTTRPDTPHNRLILTGGFLSMNGGLS